MNARDELAQDLMRANQTTVSAEAMYEQEAAEYAEYLITAGYRKLRTITTADELEALELRSIVRDSDGEPFELTDNGWRYWLYEESFSSYELPLPATVIYEPPAA